MNVCSFRLLQEQQPGDLQNFQKIQCGCVPVYPLFVFTFQKVSIFSCASEVCSMLPSDIQKSYF